MLTLLSDYGFSFRGIIHLADGSPRHAFQLFPSSTLCQPLVDYIEADILPRYDNFDAAHRRDHALSVIANSLDLARHYDVDINMVYTVAAYHDLGLVNGRERHHLDSAGILLADNRLLQWFEPAQLQVMAQAAADHRASSAQPPQTIYGRIVAEADRDIDPLKIIQRTVQFGLDNYPSLSPDQHWQRALAHLNEKYGSSGYLKLFLPESPNAQRLAELRDIIADTPRLREIFNQFFTRFSDSSR
ncbi:MAG: HD domain-containing protein [Bacteroidales bacterium]|nr:HD domain-containing protein [Bacteroidales bacterium]